jgi:hypothetical protein
MKHRLCMSVFILSLVGCGDLEPLQVDPIEIKVTVEGGKPITVEAVSTSRTAVLNVVEKP